MAIEGVDYSSTLNADWAGLAAALKGAGKAFAVRYVVGDKSPTGRGITAAETAALTAAGIDIAAVYEGTANRMQAGLAAGQADAQSAQANLVAAGLPATMPIYFASDWDALPSEQAVIDAYLKGAASVIGSARVGLYGGYWPVSRAMINKSAAWFWQTTAWSGGNIANGLHLYQYAYNQWIGGVNCDSTQALQPVYGQASKFQGGTPVPTTPAPAPKPVVTYPAGMDHGIAARAFGSFKASNGVLVQYSEGDELSALWLASGSYGRILDVGVYNDSPGIVRLTWQFSDGNLYHRPNANEPIQLVKP